jgi:Tfp pilus assembly protein FimT
LIELILVMVILVIAVAMVVPRMGDFFRGRALSAEARRFMTLTRYAQTRAVAEGLPMILWIDRVNRSYGLEAQPGYLENDDQKAVEYSLGADLQIEAGESRSIFGATQQNSMKGLAPNLPVIRFTPDGFIGEMSPETVMISDRSDEVLIIAPTRMRLRYEIKTNGYDYALQR